MKVQQIRVVLRVDDVKCRKQSCVGFEGLRFVKMDESSCERFLQSRWKMICLQSHNVQVTDHEARLLRRKLQDSSFV